MPKYISNIIVELTKKIINICMANKKNQVVHTIK